jgi:hypothetical protein
MSGRPRWRSCPYVSISASRARRICVAIEFVAAVQVLRWTPPPQSANVAWGFAEELSSGEGAIMNYDSHQRAAEFHEMAAHAHRAASVSHGKQDHYTGNEHSRQAMEHANKAHQATLEAFAQSAELAKAHSK